MPTITYNSWTEWVLGEYVAKTKKPTDTEIATVRHQLKKLERMEDKHFTKSENADDEISDAEEKLREKLLVLESAKRGYSVINLGFLGETDEKGFPSYAAHQVDTYRFRMEMEARNENHNYPGSIGWDRSDPKTPVLERSDIDFQTSNSRYALSDVYAPSLRTLMAISAEKHEWGLVFLEARTKGIAFGNSTRTQIKKAQQYFDTVFVIYNSSKIWKLNESVEYSPKVGLVFGVKNSIPFYVGSFETVKTSDYIQAELKKPAPKVVSKKSK